MGSTNNKPIWYSDNRKPTVKYLINQPMYDYDIHQANISILYDIGAINKDLYEELKNAPKDERVRRIGLMQRESNKNGGTLAQDLEDGYRGIRKSFIIANELQDNDVLETRKDSIVSLKPVKVTQFGSCQFVLKNVYTSFYKVRSYELFLGKTSGIRDSKPYLSVKGISDSTLEFYHQDFMKLLLDIFIVAEKMDTKSTVNYIKEYMNRYINLELPVGCYREFNPQSKFIIPFLTKGGGTFERVGLDSIASNRLNLLDIGFNYSILNELYRIYLSRTI